MKAWFSKQGGEYYLELIEGILKGIPNNLTGFLIFKIELLILFNSGSGVFISRFPTDTLIQFLKA